MDDSLVTPYLLVDGARVVPEIVEKPWLRFRLRLPALEVRLISGWARPSEIKNSPDARRLGVMLRAMRWSRDSEAIEVPLDAPGFIDGFHHFERPGEMAGPARWTTGDAALPPILFPPWQGEVMLHLSLNEWQGSGLEAPLSPAAAVLSRFESLGEDCEFGLAQRHHLVEPPLSLFRWGGTPVKNLIEGLDDDFSSLAQPENAELVWHGGQYFLRTPYATIHTNCKVEQQADGLAEVMNSGLATLRILRRKLLRDIMDASRIFVFKSLNATFSDGEMRRLHAALRRIGPVGVLCVRVGPPGKPIGGSEHLGDGLYAGYVDRFAPDGPFDQWLSICEATLKLHSHG
jgi:hypothetical protein